MAITQQQLIDLVQKHFPNTGETEVLLGLNQAVRQFCTDSLVNRELITITTDGSVSYSLNARIIQVDQVAEGSSLYTALQKRPEAYDGEQEKVYWIDRGSISLGTLSDGAIGAAASGLTVNLYCRTWPQDLSEFIQLLDQAGNPVLDNNNDPVYVYNELYTAGPGIPEHFHRAPVYHVLSDLYLDKTDSDLVERLRMSDRFESRYDRMVKSAQAWAEINQNGRGFVVTPHPY